MDEPYEGIFSSLLDDEPGAEPEAPLPPPPPPPGPEPDAWRQGAPSPAPPMPPPPPPPAPAAGATAPLQPPPLLAEERTAAAGILMAAAAAAVGGYLGGAWGAGAGALLFGASRNAVRAGRLWGTTEHVEASKAATVALFGFGAGGVMAYSAYQRGNR